MLRIALTLLAAAAAATTPLTWSKKTATSSLSLKLPAAVSHVPVLADRLYRGEIKELERYGRSAADPKDGQPSEPKAFRHGPWEMQVTYTPDMETGRLISLFRAEYADSHGAHPSHSDGGLIFDKTTNTNLHPLDLLKPGVNLAPLDKALCDIARTAKRSRDKDWVEKEDTNFSCPTWRGVRGRDGKMLEASAPPQIALALGSVPGKAGGVVFLYSPYDIGAYVEGSYALVVPFSVLKDVLRPGLAGEFAGAPRPDKRLDG